MADNYYVVVNKTNGALLVNNSQLPVYWNKKVANEVVKSHPRHEVKPISIDEFNKLVKKQ